jgi:hypothetical protein
VPPVWTGYGCCPGELVGDGVRSGGEGVATGNGVGEGVATGNGVGDGVATGNGVGDGVATGNGVGDGVATGNGVGDGVATGNGVGDGVGGGRGSSNGSEGPAEISGYCSAAPPFALFPACLHPFCTRVSLTACFLALEH